MSLRERTIRIAMRVLFVALGFASVNWFYWRGFALSNVDVYALVVLATGLWEGVSLGEDGSLFATAPQAEEISE